jgi:hypothetical protein
VANKMGRPEPVEDDVTARTDDYDDIVRVVQLYIDAWNDNDISKLREAFDEDAWIFYVDDKGNFLRRRQRHLS